MEKKRTAVIIIILMSVIQAAYSFDKNEFLKNRSTVSEVTAVVSSGKYTENFNAALEVTYMFRKRSLTSSEFFACRPARTAASGYTELLVTDYDGMQYWIPVSRDIANAVERSCGKDGKIIFYVMFFYSPKTRGYTYDILRCDFSKPDQKEKMQYW